MQSEYEDTCHETVTSFRKYAPEEDFTHNYDAVITSEPVAECKIGPYIHCTYHKSGLFSTIFRGFSPGCSEACAIKVTTPSTHQAPHSSVREARLLRKMTHPNVVSRSSSLIICTT